MKLVVGFITYGENTAKYLPYFLPSLFRQDIDFKILVADNTPESKNPNQKYFKKEYPHIEIIHHGENLGFAQAYNKMIGRARNLGAKYFCVLNPDMFLEEGVLSKLVKVLESDRDLGAVSPKILRWDFAHKKRTNIIDTCGIRLLAGLRFTDAGQGQKECSYKPPKIISPSGAFGLYRISALESIKQGKGEYFEELMFMYKEDCDLGYRLFLNGFICRCVERARVYHDRTAISRGDKDWQVILNRKNKSKQVKKWSIRGQQIIFFKFWHLQNLKNKFFIIFFELKMLVFALIFEPYLLKEFLAAWKERKNIKRPKV